MWVLLGGAVLGGSAVKDARNKYRSKHNHYWWSDKNFDTDRQTYYRHMCIFEKEKAEEMLGHPLVMGSPLDLYRPSVEELLKREGIDYYDSRVETENWKRAAGYRQDANGQWKKPWWK